LSFSCTSKILKYEKVDQLKKNTEFESIVKIDSLGDVSSANIQDPSSLGKNSTAPLPSDQSSPALTTNPKLKNAPIKARKSRSKIAPSQQKIAKKPNGSPKVTAAETLPSEKKISVPSSTSEADSGVSTLSPLKHLPEIEDSSGFSGRRPINDPFRVGESVVHEVTYFKVKAGEFEMKVAAPKMVNGRKSYSFVMSLRSASMFSTFYSVDDSAETLVDFEELIPRVFSLHVKESGQLREGQSYFDHNSLRATHWEKKYTEKNGNEEKKQEWDILPYSQNVFSAIYYLRTFKWEIGKEYSFRIADDKDNIMFRGKALRKEKLSTPLGEFNTIVMKPEVSVKGIFKPMGDIFFWLSDDDRKYILRMELNIKIGTLVSEVIRIIPGQN